MNMNVFSISELLSFYINTKKVSLSKNRQTDPIYTYKKFNLNIPLNDYNVKRLPVFRDLSGVPLSFFIVPCYNDEMC